MLGHDHIACSIKGGTVAHLVRWTITAARDLIAVTTIVMTVY